MVADGVQGDTQVANEEHFAQVENGGAGVAVDVEDLD